MNKYYEDVMDALDVVKDGDVILVGGFGLIGSPLTLIDGLTRKNVTNLTIVSNNLGESGRGLGKLLNQKKIGKGIGSYFTSNLQAGRAGAGAEPPGHPGGAAPGRGSGYSRLLYPNKLWHQAGGAQGNQDIPRPPVCDGDRAAWQCGADPGLSG